MDDTASVGLLAMHLYQSSRHKFPVTIDDRGHFILKAPGFTAMPSLSSQTSHLRTNDACSWSFLSSATLQQFGMLFCLLILSSLAVV